jgi:Tol biopolymer transport system component
MPTMPVSFVSKQYIASVAVMAMFAITASADESALREQLGRSHFKIAYESYVDKNWELFVMDADGSHKQNLTLTPDVSELYPQTSPDGSKIAFVVDDGEGRDTVRSTWVMNIDGSGRKKIADYAREPFWSPDSRTIAYLPQEYPKFNVVDFFTKGIMFYDLATDKTTPHPNSEKINHLYNPGFSPNGKWIVATVHAGMDLSHGILLIEAHGDRIINLEIPGCRPVISPDGKFIAWGPGDHEIATAPLDTDAETPKVGPLTLQIFDEKSKIYHVDWSPDGKFLSISRGPDGEGDLTQPHTHRAACEIVGVYAKGWNLYAVPSDPGAIHLDGPDAAALELTTDGNSNKESDWFQPNK